MSPASHRLPGTAGTEVPLLASKIPGMCEGNVNARARCTDAVACTPEDPIPIVNRNEARPVDGDMGREGQVSLGLPRTVA